MIEHPESYQAGVAAGRRAAFREATNICNTNGDVSGWVSRDAIERLIDTPSPARPSVHQRVTVPIGQTPLDDKLGHPLLDVFNEGIKARDSGEGSPYHGHSLEHCIQAAGWVQRDLRLALDKTQTSVQEAIRWIKLIRDQDQGCGGNLSPSEIYQAMQRTANEALLALVWESRP